MMLGEPDHIDTEGVGEPSLAQGFIDHNAVPRGIPAVRKQEIAEFHSEFPLAPPEVWNATSQTVSVALLAVSM